MGWVQGSCSENHLQNITNCIKVPTQIFLQLTQSVLVDTWVLQRRLQLDGGGFQPLGTAPVDQLSVDHGSLTLDCPVQVDHGHTLLICPDHPDLDYLLSYQLLQHKGRDILVICRVDVGQVALNSLVEHFIRYIKLRVYNILFCSKPLLNPFTNVLEFGR